MAAVLDLPKRTSKSWTYEDYCRLDDEGRYEIQDGELIPMQPPGASDSHQGGLANLYTLFRNFVRPQRLGKLRFAPFDVILDDRNVVQPDLLFVAKERTSIIKDNGVYGVPDLVAEFISPSSGRRDRTQKKEVYARFGVPEYWLVDYSTGTIEVFVLESGKYVLHSSSTKKGKVTSRVLEGFSVEASECFEEW
jgi:Uma2 family endonuclease